MNDLATPVPFDPHRFRSAAAHYLAGRPHYAPALIDRVAELCGLGATDRVLDLGCGPGQLAVAFAAHAGTVLAIDPEPEMLKIAAVMAAGRPSVTFLQGSSYDLGPPFGTFRLVVIGRAFHWMDRSATLRMLDLIIEPGGAVVLFSEKHPSVPDNGWTEAYGALVERYAEGEPPARDAPGWLSHEAVLLDSPFSRLERVSVIDRRQTPYEQFVDRALSMSRTPPGRLGPKADLLAEEVRALMHASARNGQVTEVVESVALIARRPEVPGR